MPRNFPPVRKVVDATPQELLDWAPERGAPVIAGYIIHSFYYRHTRAVYLYMDGGILEHNPYYVNEDAVSRTAVEVLAERARQLEKEPRLINDEVCRNCGALLSFCCCRIDEMEDAENVSCVYMSDF